jgi:cellulose synthase/poly-beta-1,6-N-acetylglucosamine synthase-like glycosyltransferase
MLISVVIPFYNAQNTISLCLKALTEQIVPAYEIILVNNRSTDKSTNIVRTFREELPDLKITLLEEYRPGPSAARNMGFKEANGDVIAFTDADCVPDQNWLKEIRDTFTDSEVGAVSGRIVGFKPETTVDRFHTMFTMQAFPQSQIFTEFTLSRGGFPTANLAVRKDVLDQISGFNEAMKIYSEDYDLCARIYGAGFSIRYTTDAVVYHQHRATLKGTWKQSFGFGTGHAALLKNHFKRILIIDMPKYVYRSSSWPTSSWIDLAGADKKLILLILLSSMWWPLVGLLVLYLFSLYKNMDLRLQENELKARFFEKWRLIFLLFFKSAAITMGRLIGSFRYRVLCI